MATPPTRALRFACPSYRGGVNSALALVCLLTSSLAADEAPRAKGRKAALSGAALQPLAVLNTPGVQEDFATACVDKQGTVWVAYLHYVDRADTLYLARLEGNQLVDSQPLSDAGNLLQPCLATAGDGTVWCVWSQLEGERWALFGRSVRNGKPGNRVTVAAGAESQLFADAKTDPRGRLWVTWQVIGPNGNDIRAAFLDASGQTWSKPVQVTRHPAGDWEPRLAFAGGDEALIVFDSYRNGNFDVFLARVTPAGEVRLVTVAASERYEARAEAVGSPDGKTLWVAYEDGVARWGKDLGSEWRRLGGGLHFDRHLYLARVDLATEAVEKLADVTPLVPAALATLGQPTSGSICLPELAVDQQGAPWLFFRYGKSPWQVGVTRYDVASNRFSQPQPLTGTSYCLDRRTTVVAEPEGTLLAVCAADGRSSNDQGDSGLVATRVDPAVAQPLVASPGLRVKQKVANPPFEPVNDTPERARGDRPEWQFAGADYNLYWGDLHRHTDFSNCRASDDGCIVEHFRYAYEAGGLDFLATTDHSDQGKGYSPYEWWQTQKLADAFHNPGTFVALYGYEREQRGPYGHRNVFFTERDGPLIYISRERFANSRWGKKLGVPPQAGARQGDLSPEQLWALLRKSGKRALAIAHTPAGDDWSLFKQIDAQVEPVIEIYQGSRQSYEGGGAPQPTVAQQKPPKAASKAGGNGGRGRFQDALQQGHKLGVIASSDHRSTNLSYAGVYATRFDRNGLFDAIDARHTFAATDKIELQFSCNGHLLGEAFQTDQPPTLSLAVHGTAPLKAVTVLGNETAYKVFTPTGKDLEAEFRDANPVAGENRYYLRIEQVDGNMAWTSPVWVTYNPH